MKLDQQTGQSLIRAAMRERHAPGKYDLFVWRNERELQSIAVAWKSYTKRTIDLENVANGDGGEIPTNAAPLPNGIERHGACYVGSFRIEKSLETNES
ncbi:MAG: hypothetical protein JSR99_16925 [Proteobacteria bacterium]|nr:hypothetical protein [Pseudomonadota bacterium]